jgi:hypothetical protein
MSNQGEDMKTNNSGLIHFDLRDSVEKNFNAYQDALEESPELFKQLKWLYDQYLKTLPHYTKEMDVEEGTDIAFEVVS